MNMPKDDMYAEYISSTWLNKNYFQWNSLRVEEHRMLATSRFFTILSLGLPRFHNLELIDFDDFFAWSSAEHHNAELIQKSGTHPELFPKGSPLSRTWKMFYPRPSTVKDPSKHVKNVLRALSKSNCFIKGLDLSPRANTGLPSNFFRHCRIDQGLGY